jgi:hypothetical protein
VKKNPFWATGFFEAAMHFCVTRFLIQKNSWRTFDCVDIAFKKHLMF